MDKKSNYLQDALGTLALKHQLVADNPIRTVAGAGIAGVLSSPVLAPLALSPAAPITGLAAGTLGSLGGRIALGPSKQEADKRIDESVRALSESGQSYKELLKRQYKRNIKKNLFMDIPGGMLIGGVLGAMAPTSSLATTPNRGKEILKNILLGGAIGGGAQAVSTQAGNLLGPALRRILMQFSSPKSVQAGGEFVKNRPIVSSLPLSEFAAPAVAEEYVGKKANAKRANIADDVVSSLRNYRPLNTVDATLKGIPVGALLGATAGGVAQSFRDPGYDEMGQKKKKYKEILKGMLTGGAIGGLGMAAMPSLAQAGIAARGALRNLSNRPYNLFDPLSNAGKTQLESFIAPLMTTKDLADWSIGIGPHDIKWR